MESKKHISSISDDLIYKRNRDTYAENKSMDTKGECGEWDGLGGWKWYIRISRREKSFFSKW